MAHGKRKTITPPAILCCVVANSYNRHNYLFQMTETVVYARVKCEANEYAVCHINMRPAHWIRNETTPSVPCTLGTRARTNVFVSDVSAWHVTNATHTHSTRAHTHTCTMAMQTMLYHPKWLLLAVYIYRGFLLLLRVPSTDYQEGREPNVPACTVTHMYVPAEVVYRHQKAIRMKFGLVFGC